VKGIKDPPDGKSSSDVKNAPKQRDKAAEARVEERERRFRAFQDGLRAIAS